MKKIQFIKHAGKYRLAYRPGESGKFEDKQADQLIKDGFAVAVHKTGDDSDLPEDIPGRKALVKEDISFDELKKINDFSEIPGINEKTAGQIKEYLTKKNE